MKTIQRSDSRRATRFCGFASPDRMTSAAPATGRIARHDGYGVPASSIVTAATMSARPMMPIASIATRGRRLTAAASPGPIRPPAMNSQARHCGK